MIISTPGHVMIHLLSVAATYVQCGKTDAVDPWYAFKEIYGKKYRTPQEEVQRKQIFYDNIQKITQHNALYTSGVRSFKLGTNQFTDLKSHELPTIGWIQYDDSAPNEGLRGLNIKPIQFEATGAELPLHVDWRGKGVVSPVKDQHNCLGCYAFAATDAIESQYALKYGKRILLSQQQLIDCSAHEGNLGCKGGMVDWTYKYILNAKGVQYYEDYPFLVKRSSCKFNSSRIGASISNYVEIKNGSETSLQEAVAFFGPVSASISSKDFGWNFFTAGIYDNPECPAEVDHSVLVVGYGTEDHKDYWIVKNSYGKSFGDKGYIKMSRNKGNQCAIASYANFPVVGQWEPFSKETEITNTPVLTTKP